jgi:hypothetical protein
MISKTRLEPAEAVWLSLAIRLDLLGKVLERRRRLVRRALADRRGVLVRAVLPIRWEFEESEIMSGRGGMNTDDDIV